jgi:hypothetical protein
MDALERVIRPIVEGQLRSFLSDHPEVADAVDWYKPRLDKQVTFVNSVAKRIVRDLTCPSTRARLAAALVEETQLRDGKTQSCHRLVGLQGDGVELRPAPSLTLGDGQ